MFETASEPTVVSDSCFVLKVRSEPAWVDAVEMPDGVEGASPPVVFDVSVGSAMRVMPDNNVVDVAVLFPGLGRSLAAV